MIALPATLRRQLEKTVLTARSAAESGAGKALRALGVQHAEPPAHLTQPQHDLHEKLRAQAQVLGDRGALTHLIEKIAYDQWHRLLFSRFLVENELLIHPEHGVALSLHDLEDLAAEEGIREPWDLASRFTAALLPAIFRPGDPAGELTRSRLPHLTVLRDGYAYFLVPALALADAGTGTGTENNTADRWLAGSVAGVSDTVGRPARAPEAAAEAGWALSASEAEGRSLLHFGEGTILLPRTVAEAEAIVARVLGPLLAHDERTGEYLKTVRVILELDRSWQAAAAQLHIHKQTLGYRLRKIEALTGRGFVRTEHLAEWWMALRAYDMLAGLGTSRRVS